MLLFGADKTFICEESVVWQKKAKYEIVEFEAAAV